MLSSRPVPFGPRRSANILPRNNDENAVARSNVKNSSDGTVTKTPATGKGRRAFGDISNHRHESTASKGLLPKTPSLVLKPKPVATQTSSKTVVSKPLPHKTAPKRRVEFSIPAENLPKEESQVGAQKGTSKTEEDAWSVEEPEKPYGRTYLQQLEFDEDDDDHSFLSLEGVNTLLEDLDNLKDMRRKIETQRKEEMIQKQLEDFDNEISVFGQTEEYVPSPDSSDLIGYLDSLEVDLDIGSDNESFCDPDISFG